MVRDASEREHERDSEPGSQNESEMHVMTNYEGMRQLNWYKYAIESIGMSLR